MQAGSEFTLTKPFAEERDHATAGAENTAAGFDEGVPAASLEPDSNPVGDVIQQANTKNE